MKHGAFFTISEAMLAMADGFYQKSHTVPREPAPEEVALHARAVELVAEVRANPYVVFVDGEVEAKDLETESVVWDETDAEWMARYRAWREQTND